MNDFTTPIVQALIVAAILGLVAWAWAKRKPLKKWFASNEEKAAKAKKLTAASDVEDLRRQVVKVARTLNEVLVESATGTRPMVATYTTGERHAFFTDFQAYKAGMRADPAGAQRTHHVRQLPVPVARWSRERCETWLGAHPL